MIAYGWKLQLLVLIISVAAYATLKRKLKHPYAGRRAALLWVILAIGALVIGVMNIPEHGLTL